MEKASRKPGCPSFTLGRNYRSHQETTSFLQVENTRSCRCSDRRIYHHQKDLSIDYSGPVLLIRDVDRKYIPCDLFAIIEAIDAGHVEESPFATALGQIPNVPSSSVLKTMKNLQGLKVRLRQHCYKTIQTLVSASTPLEIKFGQKRAMDRNQILRLQKAHSTLRRNLRHY